MAPTAGTVRTGRPTVELPGKAGTYRSATHEGVSASASAVEPPPAQDERNAARRRLTVPAGRLWQIVVGGTAVLVLVAICALGSAAILMQDDTATTPSAPVAQPSATRSPSPLADQLDSRDTDPLPLTAKEVFPNRRLVVAEGQPAYQVLRTQSSASCAVAASDDIADLLVRLGCSQVVRATLQAPDGGHLATAGLFNLTDRASAERVRERIREILNERRGRILGMEAGEGTEVVTRAAARVAWQVRGHYLAYCLVVRADGDPVEADDPGARKVLFDLIQLHLDREVLEHRTNPDLAQPSGEPAEAPSESTPRHTPR